MEKEFKCVLKVNYEVGDVVEHIVSIPSDCEFKNVKFRYHVITCKAKETGEESTRLMTIAIKLTENVDYKNETPATWVWDTGIWGRCDSGEIGSDHEPHPSFKNAWIRFAVSQYWTVQEAIIEVEGKISWSGIEESPEEGEGGEEEPSEPEKPTEPFDIGKWLEWALRKILRDEEPPTCKPHNTILLITLMTTIYLNTIINFDEWATMLGLIPMPTILIGEFWRIFTYMWLHAPITQAFNGYIIPHAHIAFNMLFLYVFGDNVECRIGYGKYIAYYIVFGIVAGLGEVMWLHMVGQGTQYVVIVGASGAVSGLLGMYLVFFPNNNLVFMEKKVKAYYFIGMWFISQIALLFERSSGIAVMSHIVGFVLGILIGLLEKKMMEEKEKWEKFGNV